MAEGVAAVAVADAVGLAVDVERPPRGRAGEEFEGALAVRFEPKPEIGAISSSCCCGIVTPSRASAPDAQKSRSWSSVKPSPPSSV